MSKLIDILTGLSCLYRLPVVLLQIIVDYTLPRPVKGRYVESFGTYGFGPGEFCDPISLAISKSTRELFVLDQGNRRVQVFSVTNLTFLREWGTLGSGPGQFQQPSGICVYETTVQSPARVLVTDSSNSRIQEFQLDGTFIRFIRVSRKRHLDSPWGITVDSKTRVAYVSERFSFNISVFSLDDGRRVRYFKCPGGGDPKLSHTQGLHFDEERGLLIVTDYGKHRVKVLRPDGSMVRIIGRWVSPLGIEHQLTHPENVCVDATGAILISDYSEHNNIHAWSLSTGPEYTCTPIHSFAKRRSEDDEQLLSDLSGFCIDPHTGRLFATDWENRCVSIFE